MKLVLRIISIAFVLTSISAFADTIGGNLNASVAIGANTGAGDNVSVGLFGQGVAILAGGGTPLGWFDSDVLYFPGDQGLGPTTVFWDTGSLMIGSQGYDFDQFDLDSTLINIPFITFPTNGKDFTVTNPWTWELSGTILTNCPSSGCGFDLVSKPGKLSISFLYASDLGAYVAGPASFTTTPEPGTFAFMTVGISIGAIAWRRFSYSC